MRLRFDAVLKSLGYEVAEEVRGERAEVISLLERGEISADEATVRLRALQR